MWPGLSPYWIAWHSLSNPSTIWSPWFAFPHSFHLYSCSKHVTPLFFHTMFAPAPYTSPSPMVCSKSCHSLYLYPALVFSGFLHNIGRAETECDGTQKRTGGEVKGKRANGGGSQQSCTVSDTVYPALLPLMRTPRLPAADWTDTPADVNGLVCFAGKPNLVSARVPSRSVSALPLFHSQNAFIRNHRQAYIE